jgi:hypothetical protein
MQFASEHTHLAHEMADQVLCIKEGFPIFGCLKISMETDLRIELD